MRYQLSRNGQTKVIEADNPLSDDEIDEISDKVFGKPTPTPAANPGLGILSGAALGAASVPVQRAKTASRPTAAQTMLSTATGNAFANPAPMVPTTNPFAPPTTAIPIPGVPNFAQQYQNVAGGNVVSGNPDDTQSKLLGVKVGSGTGPGAIPGYSDLSSAFGDKLATALVGLHLASPQAVKQYWENAPAWQKKDFLGKVGISSEKMNDTLAQVGGTAANMATPPAQAIVAPEETARQLNAYPQISAAMAPGNPTYDAAHGVSSVGTGLLNDPLMLAGGAFVGGLGKLGQLGGIAQKLAEAGFALDQLGTNAPEFVDAIQKGDYEKAGRAGAGTVFGTLIAAHITKGHDSAVTPLIDAEGKSVPTRVTLDGDNFTIQTPKRGDIPGAKETMPPAEVPAFLEQQRLRHPSPQPVVNMDLTEARPGETVHATDGTKLRVTGGNKRTATVQNVQTKETFSVPRIPEPVAEPSASQNAATPSVQAGEIANPIPPTVTPPDVSTPTQPEYVAKITAAAEAARQRVAAINASRQQVPETVAPEAGVTPPIAPARELTPAEVPQPTTAPTVKTDTLKPAEIKVLPGMQYKKSGIVDTKAGVTDVLKGTDVYDVDQGGRLTVWRDENGNNYAVNGHHRAELANRAKSFVKIGPDGKPVSVPNDIPVNVLDAKDGWTMQAARARGALENVRDGKGTALDAIEVMQGLGMKPEDFSKSGISTTGDMARNMGGLMSLDEASLNRVRSGDVPEAVAAGIGSVEGLTPEAQHGAIDESATRGDTTHAKGQKLALEYLEDQRNGTLAADKSGQVDLFGGEFEAAKSTRGIRVDLKEAVSRKLSAERSNLLKPVGARLREGEHIDEAARQTEAQGMAESNKALAERLNLLYQQDTVKAEIARLAGEVGNGRLTKEQAAGQLADALRPHVGRSVADLANPGAVSLNSGSGVSGLSEPGTPQVSRGVEDTGLFTQEVKPSIVERISDAADKARENAAKRKAKGGTLNTGPNVFKGLEHYDLSDILAIGADHLVRGATAFADWSKAMVEEFGEAVRPHLQAIYDASLQHFREVSGQIASTETLERPVENPTPKTGSPPPVKPPTRPPTTSPVEPPKAATEAPTAPIKPIPQTTGAKNAITEAERAQRGMTPVERQLYTKMGDAYVQGKASVQAFDSRDESVRQINPVELAQKVADKPRPLDAVEIGALTFDRTRIKADYERAGKALDEAIAGGDKLKIAERQADLDAVQQAANLNEDALVKGGREQSAAFNARKMIVIRDYSSAPDVVSMATRAKGSDVSATVAKQLKDSADALKAKQAELDAALAALEAQKKPASVRQQQNKSAQSTPEPLATNFGSKNTVFTADKAAEAKQRIADKLKQIGVQADPFGAQTAAHLASLIPDLVEVGGYYLEGGIRKFGDWAARMREDVPNADDATLQHVWAQVKAEAQKLPDAKTIPEPSNFTEVLGKRMGWQKASAFLDAITEEDGSPRILDKLIHDEQLVPAEKAILRAAYTANAPTRAANVVNAVPDVLYAIRDAVNEGKEAAARPKRIQDLQAKIDDIRQQLESGNLKPLAKREPGTLSPQQQELKDLRVQLAKERTAQIPISEQIIADNAANPQRAADAKAAAAKAERAKEASAKREAIIQGKIDDLTEQLTTGNLKPTVPGVKPTRTALEQQLADLRKQVAKERTAQSQTDISDKDVAKYAGDPQARADAKAKVDRIEDLQKQAVELERAMSSPEELKKWETANEKAKAERKAKADAVPANVQKLMQERDYLRKQVEARIEAQKPKSALEKFVQMSRQFKLSGVSVFAKLGGASLWAPPVEALADIASVPYSKLPAGGGKTLGEVAPREGAFSPSAEVTGLRKMASREALNNARDTIINGFNSLDVQSGKDLHVDNANEGPLKYIGRLHGAMKSFLQTGQFHKALEIRLQKARAAGVDLSTPEEVAKIGMGAAVDAQNVKLQGDNALSDVLNGIVGKPEMLAKSGKYSAQTNSALNTLSAVMRTMVPIVKIPANYIGKAVDMTGLGVARGAKLHFDALKEAKTSGEAMSPEVADNILRAYKYGSLGLVAMYLGIAQPKWFQTAGFYSHGADYGTGADGEPKEASGLEIGGKTVPKILSHNPFLEAVQFWATVRRGFEQSKAETGVGKVGSGAYQAIRGMAEEAPGLESTAQVADALKDEGSGGKAAGQYVKGLIIPQIVQQGAKLGDRDSQGKVVPRDQKGFTQTVQEGIPGLRNRLPVKGSTNQRGASIVKIDKNGKVKINLPKTPGITPRRR